MGVLQGNWLQATVCDGQYCPAANSADWKDVHTSTNRPASLTDAITFNAPVTGRFFRLYVTGFTSVDPNGAVPEWPTIAVNEFELYGDETAAPSTQDPQQNVARGKNAVADSQRQAPSTPPRPLMAIRLLRAPAGRVRLTLLPPRTAVLTGFMSIWASSATSSASVYSGSCARPRATRFRLPMARPLRLPIALTGRPFTPTTVILQARPT